MQREDKERVVAELTEKLRAADTLIVADYRGLTMPQIDGLRTRLLEHGASFSVVKNTLTRRAAEAAGVEALLALLEGPSAIAFIEASGDAVAVAKALSESARETKILALRGGIMQGRTISADELEELAKLPPLDVLRGQVIGAVIAPLNNLLALVNAPLQNLVGLIDARIEQLEAGGEAAPAAGAEAEAEAAPATEAEAGAEPDSEVESGAEAAPAAEAEPAEESGNDDAQPQAAEEEADDGGS